LETLKDVSIGQHVGTLIYYAPELINDNENLKILKKNEVTGRNKK
jgi:hypothetical protein